MPLTGPATPHHYPCADISELNLAKGTSINFPQGKDKLLIFDITIQPDEGYYRCLACAISLRAAFHMRFSTH